MCFQRGKATAPHLKARVPNMDDLCPTHRIVRLASSFVLTFWCRRESRLQFLLINESRGCGAALEELQVQVELQH
jgi:hypothetical protein